MIDHIDLFNLHLSGIMLTLTVLGLIISAIMPGIERWNRNFFMSLFAINILLVGDLLGKSRKWLWQKKSLYILKVYLKNSLSYNEKLRKDFAVNAYRVNLTLKTTSRLDYCRVSMLFSASTARR